TAKPLGKRRVIGRSRVKLKALTFYCSLFYFVLCFASTPVRDLSRRISPDHSKSLLLWSSVHGAKSENTGRRLLACRISLSRPNDSSLIFAAVRDTPYVRIRWLVTKRKF